MQKQELYRLETQIKELIDGIGALVEGGDLEKVLTIIHRPGFTTVAECLLMHAIAESMNMQVKSMLALKQAFVSAASKVEINPQPLPPAFHLA